MPASEASTPVGTAAPTAVPTGPSRSAGHIALARVLTARRADWRDNALCTQTDPEAFYPEKGQPSSPAKRICQICEVRSECLQAAVDHHERYGIWGGLTENERRHWTKTQRTAA